MLGITPFRLSRSALGGVASYSHARHSATDEKPNRRDAQGTNAKRLTPAVATMCGL
jgi:hypothetical protein